jgi:hypothetical protein
VEERASEGEGTGREEKWEANEFTITTIHREECSNLTLLGEIGTNPELELYREVRGELQGAKNEII